MDAQLINWLGLVGVLFSMLTFYLAYVSPSHTPPSKGQARVRGILLAISFLILGASIAILGNTLIQVLNGTPTERIGALPSQTITPADATGRAATNSPTAGTDPTQDVADGAAPPSSTAPTEVHNGSPIPTDLGDQDAQATNTPLPTNTRFVAPTEITSPTEVPTRAPQVAPLESCPPARWLGASARLEIDLAPNTWYHLNISRNAPSDVAEASPVFETNLHFQLAPGIEKARISFNGSAWSYEGEVTTSDCALCVNATGNWVANLELPKIFDFASPCGARNENIYPEIINYIEWEDASGSHRWP